VGAIEIGMRELQRSASRVMATVQDEGVHAIVSRYGRPLAVIVPLAYAQAWVLQNRPLADGVNEDDSLWIVDEGVRLSPTAEGHVAALAEPVRVRLFAQLRRLRRLQAVGRVAVKAGLFWALVDLNGDEPPTLLEVARSAELRRWFYAARGEDQPM
jgi:prevent-host-death family protein